MEILSYLIPALVTLITSGAIYFRLNKKFREAEVKEKEAEVLQKQDDEWQELYREARDRVQGLEKTIEKLRQEKSQLAKDNGLLELKVQQLTWFRCKVNNCPKRQPPHVFDIEGNEFESPDKEN